MLYRTLILTEMQQFKLIFLPFYYKMNIPCKYRQSCWKKIIVILVFDQLIKLWYQLKSNADS